MDDKATLSMSPGSNWRPCGTGERSVDGSGKPRSGGGKVLLRAVPGLLIVIGAHSRVVGLSQERPPIWGSWPVGLPATVMPKTLEMSCGDSMEHVSIGLAAPTVLVAPLAGAL